MHVAPLPVVLEGLPRELVQAFIAGIVFMVRDPGGLPHLFSLFSVEVNQGNIITLGVQNDQGEKLTFPYNLSSELLNCGTFYGVIELELEYPGTNPTAMRQLRQLIQLMADDGCITLTADFHDGQDQTRPLVVKSLHRLMEEQRLGLEILVFPEDAGTHSFKLRYPEMVVHV